MAVCKEVLASVGKAVASGAAVDHQVEVRTAGTLDGLRAALRPVFAEHGGWVLAQMPGVNSLLVTDVSIPALKAIAALPETKDIKPSYFLGSPC
ncbi:MAG: hypothetical protein H6862_00515 [Rhodospirillales bacterium]|nr:hypothetical protein [Rhodospirillales bacterium]